MDLNTKQHKVRIYATVNYSHTALESEDMVEDILVKDIDYADRDDLLARFEHFINDKFLYESYGLDNLVINNIEIDYEDLGEPTPRDVMRITRQEFLFPLEDCE